MCQSPIEITQNNFAEDIVRNIHTQISNCVMKTIYDMGVNVDKEELIKALQRDRGQYNKGYQDGLNDNKKYLSFIAGMIYKLLNEQKLTYDEEQALDNILSDLNYWDLDAKEFRY